MDAGRVKHLAELGWEQLPDDSSLFVRNRASVEQDDIDWTSIPEGLSDLEESNGASAPRSGSKSE